jgi:hypothetical protein
VVVKGSDVKIDQCCTERGLLLLLLEDGSVYYQTCYYCKNAVETIISPQAILDGSDIFVEWQQTGYKDDSPGLLWFSSASGLASMSIVLEKRDGLYYTHTDVYTVDKDPVCPMYPTVQCILNLKPPGTARSVLQYVPITESELWMVQLGCPRERQLDMLPGNITGISSYFEYHPFCYTDFKEQARIWKQAAQRSAECTTDVHKQFYVDYGFTQALTLDYQCPNKASNRVVT